MHLTTSASIYVPFSADQVFSRIIDVESIPALFHGWGPVPGTLEARLVTDGGMVRGAVREVTNADGSVIQEDILVVDAPRCHAYRLRSGLRPPFKWLVRGGTGRWDLTVEPGGTRVVWAFTWELRSALLWPVVKLLSMAFGRAMRDALMRLEGLLSR